MSLTVHTVDLTKAQIDFVKDSSSQQTETTVSNNNECITKNHVRPDFYFTFCQTAKRNQHYKLNSINTNNSTSVEQNCQPLAQNKFNT